MAKYEKSLTGNFQEFLQFIQNKIENTGGVSVSLEDGSDYLLGDFRVAVRVYERYSMAGGNRVSLNITLVGKGNNLFITAITSGGSQAVFFKVNTFGEETFLEVLINSVESYISNHN